MKGLLVLVILIAAAMAVGYYWISRPTTRFTFSVYPEFFHVAPGQGEMVNVSISRSTGFMGDVQISIVNSPSWVISLPQTISSAETNATIPVIAAANAPKGPIQLTLTATSPGASDQFAQVQMRVVGVKSYSSINGNSTIYDTTKSIDSQTIHALVQYANGTLTFSQMTPLLQNLTMGDVIVAGPSPPNAPLGFFRVVLSTNEQNGQVVVQTSQANLLDAFQQADIHTNNSTGKGGAASTSSIGPQGYRPAFGGSGVLPVIPQTKYTPPGLPLNAGALTANAYVSFGAGIDYDFHAHIAWPSSLGDAIKAASCAPGGVVAMIACGFSHIDDAHLFLEASETAHGDITGVPGSVSYSKDLIDPVTFGPFVLFAIGPVTISLDVTLHPLQAGASGNIQAGFYARVDQSFTITVGPEYSDNSGFDFVFQPTHSESADAHLDLKPGTKNNPELYIGPKVDIDVDGGSGLLKVGPSGALHFFVRFNSEVPHNPVWSIDAGLEGCMGADVSIFFGALKYNPQKCGDLFKTTVLTSTNYPPTVQITSPHDGDTLTVQPGANPPPFTFQGTVFDPQGGTCTNGIPSQGMTVSWTSNIEGNLGNTCYLTVQASLFLTSGPRQITFSAIDSGGQKGSATININVNVPSPPSISVKILAPNPQLTYYVAPDSVGFTGTGTVLIPALFKTPSTLACSALTWTITGPSTPSPPPSGTGTYSGCSFHLRFSTPGSYKVTLSASFTCTVPGCGSETGQTLRADATPITITIKELTTGTNLAPSAEFTNPSQGATYCDGGGSYCTMTISANVNEPEGEAVTWTLDAQWGLGFSYRITSGSITATSPSPLSSQISYTWDIINTICKNPDFTTQPSWPVTLLLSMSDGVKHGDAQDLVTLGCIPPTYAINAPFSQPPNSAARAMSSSVIVPRWIGGNQTLWLEWSRMRSLRVVRIGYEFKTSDKVAARTEFQSLSIRHSTTNS